MFRGHSHASAPASPLPASEQGFGVACAKPGGDLPGAALREQPLIAGLGLASLRACTRGPRELKSRGGGRRAAGAEQKPRSEPQQSRGCLKLSPCSSQLRGRRNRLRVALGSVLLPAAARGLSGERLGERSVPPPPGPCGLRGWIWEGKPGKSLPWFLPSRIGSSSVLNLPPGRGVCPWCCPSLPLASGRGRRAVPSPLPV